MRETSLTPLSWECLDCHLIADSLSIHGKCSNCGSGAVAAQAAILLPDACRECGMPLLDGEITTSDFKTHISCSNPKGIASREEAYA